VKKRSIAFYLFTMLTLFGIPRSLLTLSVIIPLMGIVSYLSIVLSDEQGSHYVLPLALPSTVILQWLSAHLKCLNHLYITV